MQVLVTGATGRIGSRFVPRLLQRNVNVQILARDQGRADHLGRLGARIVAGDLLEPETLPAAVEGVDAIVHLAAFFRGASEAEAQATNTGGTVALARAALAAGGPRLLFASTNLVYGPGPDRPAVETDPPQPAPGYPATKAAAEQSLQALYEGRPGDLCILRLAFVYGDNDPHVPEAFSMFGGWHPARRLHAVHHADVAQALLLALMARGRGGIYNVADDAPISLWELRHLFGQAETPPTAAHRLDRPWEGIVSTLKIRDELGFRPIYPSLYTARDAGAL